MDDHLVYRFLFELVGVTDSFTLHFYLIMVKLLYFTIKSVGYTQAVSNPVIDSAEQLGSAIMVLDFNDDGVEDLIIGASADNFPGIDAGPVYFKLYK